jgi:signal peptide peptidase SppA
MSRMDPLDVLLEQNKKKSDKPKSTTDDKTAADTEEATSPTKDADQDTTTTTPLDSWKYETDFDHFSADSKISISEYARQRKLERSKESKMWAEYRQISESTGLMRSIYALLGYKAPYYNVSRDKYSASNVMGVKEKIAVIKINGAITETTARKAEKALRSVKNQKDVKCVVLRVDSPGGSINACETIYQRIQDLPQKVVVSFGNVSASGGYYISANAERIFASPTTITGSIGVFMLRVDIRGLAMRYGITFDSIPTSPLSGSFDPCFPITTTMEDNFAISSDRAYHRFKSLVSNGRGMDMDAVEAVAKGRVWTGEQAKEFGLVDELGGLQRAVAYAQRECTSTGHAEVVQWPPKKSIWQMLMQQDLNDMELLEVWKALLSGLVPQSNFFGRRSSPGNFSSSDCEIFSSLSSALPVTNGVMLTADENTAIRIALEENGIDLPLSSTAVPGGVWKL